MMRQYLEVKAQHPDALLLYRMGDFFELFYEDAKLAAPILEVALTARHKGSESEAPMCGVPHHALDSYLGKLLKAGLKVAICDQVEDPAQAKGLVKREVTRIVTPGTVSQPELLDGKEENLLSAVLWDGERGAGAFLEVSTGVFFLRRWGQPESCLEDLGVLRPREVLFAPAKLPAAVLAWLQSAAICLTPLSAEQVPSRGRAAQLLERQLQVATLKGYGLDPDEPAVAAAACALAYAQETQHSELAHIRTLTLGDPVSALVLDATTLANLEVFRNQREGNRKGTLLAVLDRTQTPAGGRLLREWLRRPLCDLEQITARHAAVAELAAHGSRREDLRASLAELGDPERLLSRAVLGTMTPREAAALRDGLRQVPAVQAQLQGLSPSAATTPLLAAVVACDPLTGLADELSRVLVEAPPATLKNGGVIAAGVDPELDRCYSLAHDSKQHILVLEQQEREATGISSLKIRYNRVFGYYLEITHANAHLVPSHYIRKQTLVNAERYVTPEIKDLEEQILGAEERQLELEAQHFAQLLERITAEGEGLLRLSRALAALDVVATFAEVAVRQRFRRPHMLPPGAPIRIRDGRHPVVEAMSREPFVPNDVELDCEVAQVVLLTGPNMGGKSTYLRQVALMVLLAQAGSFVPAEEAEIGLVDRIFTRVGASDDLARGESTFMVEMIETANILHHATDLSLVILDEVGRGTATFDGLSLAWAIVEYLHEKRRAKTLFATHYHELTELANLLPRVKNRTMAVKEWEDKIVFLRRVIHGSADKSYGLHVARLAGLPTSVIARAQEVLANLEAQEYDFSGRPRLAQGEHHPQPAASGQQLSLFTPPGEAVLTILREVDLEQLTPLAALNLLASLKTRL